MYGIVASLYCMSETTTTLYVNYPRIKILKISEIKQA